MSSCSNSESYKIETRFESVVDNESCKVEYYYPRFISNESKQSIHELNELLQKHADYEHYSHHNPSN